MTTYTGPGVRGLLIPGQKVIRTERGVRYDTTDPTYLLCDENPLTTITGVPESDLRDDAARLVCSRCFREVAILVPWAKGLDTGARYNCCLACLDEIIGIAANPLPLDDAAWQADEQAERAWK